MAKLKDRFLIPLIVTLPAVIFGFYIRVSQLDQQILGEDEWNSIRYAVTRSYEHILTHFHNADNSAPLTAFYKFLAENSELNLWGIRSLQLIFGLLTLLILPLLIQPLFKTRTAFIFSWLLALSPFLIFYSRFARPYSMVAFLGFFSLLALYDWVKRQKHPLLVLYLLSTLLAAYFNILAFIFCAAPFVFILIRDLLKPPKILTLKRKLALGSGLLATAMILILPRLNSLTAVSQKVGEGSFGLKTLLGAMKLFCGTPHLVMAILLASLFIYGLFLGFRRAPLLCGFFVTSALCLGAGFFIIQPHMMQAPGVFARYSIACLPIWLLLISLALTTLFDWASLRLKTYKTTIFLLLFIPLLLLYFFQGPLPSTYFKMNSFTNHHLYQNYFRKHATTITSKQKAVIPQFYRTLKDEPGDFAILEAPLFAKWILVNYPLYQIIHQKRVVIGRTEDSLLMAINNLHHKNLRLHNFIHIRDPGDLIRKQVKYVVFHKDILNELVHVREQYDSYKPILREIKRSWEHLEKTRILIADKKIREAVSEYTNQQDPFYEDRWIVVFKVS